MAKTLVIATHGSEDPTRATLAWLMAKGMLEAGHQPQVLLMGDAGILAHRQIAEGVQGLGTPSLKEIMGFVLEKKVPVFV